MFTLTFLDAQHQVLQEIESAPIRGTTDWTPVRIGPVAPASDQTRALPSYRFAFDPRPERICGAGYLSNVRLARLPRLTLCASGLHNVYFTGDPVEVTTDISGMSAHDNQVLFSLLDPYGTTLAEQKQVLTPSVLEPVKGDTKASLAASATWRPQLPGPGFYRVRVSMVGDDGLALERTLSLVMLQPQPPPGGNEFGWSLPAAERPWGVAPLTTLLPQAGIHWVKFPVWHAESDTVR